jgi:GntR family transcriptional regulator
MAMPDRLIETLQARLNEPMRGWPIYRRLTAIIEAEIRAGRLRRGDPLPGERALAAGLGISRVTVRKALDRLMGDGLLVRRQGARTEVNPRVEKALSGLTSFSEDMRQRGLVPESLWLRRELVRPGPAEMLALCVGAATPVWRLERVRLADGRPLALEVATVPQRFLPSIETVGSSLYAALEAAGAMPVRAVQKMRAAPMTAADRRALRCDEGEPVLEIERRCFLPSGDVVEVSRSRYRGAVYDFVVELTR